MIRHFFRLSALSCVVGLLGSCDVATVERAPSSIALNHCNTDSDCSGGSCEGGQCRSNGGALQTVLLSITPPADGSSVAGVQFLKPNVSLPSPDLPLEVDLDAMSQIVGSVLLASKYCPWDFYNDNDLGAFYAMPTDLSIPAFVTLIPSVTALGLYSPTSIVKSSLADGTSFTFSVNVPPGDYDIYVEPGSQADNSCTVPPQLLRGQHINGGSLSLKIKIPKPSNFDFHVSWPAADHQLDGWYADMLDPVSGRVISNRVQLTLQGKEYTAQISYLPVVVGDAAGDGAGELVRLSPPDGVTAPTVLADRGALALLHADDTGTLDDLSLPTPITLQGQVAAQATPRAVASTVTLVATKITGMDPGILASFVRNIVVGSDGQFSVDVLPGSYLVSAVPSVQLSNSTGTDNDPDSKLAAATQEWVVPSAPSVQAGKLVSLGNPLPINGSAVDTLGAGVATAPVQAVASFASIQNDVLQQLLPTSAQVCRGAASATDLCKPTYVPRASDGIVDKYGVFALLADPGTFDVTVRPLASTGFGWLVFPSVGVDTTRSNSAGPNLGVQSMPLPVQYNGKVTTPGADSVQPLPNALLRAYVYLSKGQYVADPSKADSVVQVAETRADNDGSFQLLIPASLNAVGQ